MKRIKLRAKLVKIISSLDEIILCEGKQTGRFSVLWKCRKALQGELAKVDAPRKTFDFVAITSSVIRLIDLLCRLFCEKTGN